MNEDTLMVLAASLGMGLLVGLQREFSGHPIAGIRTFTLISLFGTVLAAQQTDFYWLAAAGLLSVAIIMVLLYLAYCLFGGGQLSIILCGIRHVLRAFLIRKVSEQKTFIECPLKHRPICRDCRLPVRQ